MPISEFMIKYTFLLSIVFLTATCLYGQPFDYNAEDYQLKELQYENASGEIGLTTFLFNNKGNIYKAVWRNIENQRYSENYYIRRHGKLKKIYREFSDSLTSSKVFMHDSLGRIIKEEFERSDGKEGHAFYFYDSKGKLKEMDCQGLNGWFHGKISYIYDKNGLKKLAKITRDNKEIGTIQFKYSKNENLLEEHWDFKGKWSQRFKYVYTPKNIKTWANSNPLLNIPRGYRIKYENYSYNNDLGGPSYFKYNKKGQLVEKTFVRNDGLRTKTNYAYDKNNAMIRSERHYASGEKALFTYKYNPYGQIKEKSYQHSNGSSGRESFLYDANGRLIAARYDNMDTWLTGTLFFKHNMFDQITGADFIADKGYTAEIDFSLTKEGLAYEILWKFSFGATQLYVFEYEYIE